MTRGYSLEQDLRFLINNPKYSDIEILCEDEKKLYGCRVILAARSEVFERLLYNGIKKSYETQIFFPKINSTEMEIVLEYIYTGSVKEESLTKDNIIETFYVADYFQLLNLQGFIMKTFKNILKKNYTEDYSPELLSKFVERMPLMVNRIYSVFLNLLVEAVANIPLNTIEFGRLSIAGLQYLLSCTYEKEKHFTTREYEVFRYSAILAAKQVSNDAFKTLLKRLPTLDQIENSIQVESEPITDHQKVAKELEPLVEFINFRRIKGSILVDMIEPLEIVPAKIILNIYRQCIKSNNFNLNDIRGIPKIEYVWDETACGSKLVIGDNGKVIRVPKGLGSWRSFRAKMVLEYSYIYEWDVIIEKASWVGVASENLNYEDFAGNQPNGWVLGSCGGCYNSGYYKNDYCLSFGDGARITVHLDMNKRTCAFTVNGTKYPEVPSWNNLPSKLYPVASLCYPGQFRIQPHKKNI
ncbi:hypothetical protein RirG_079890 [Rhizophagus irregularis DAOM 197198w]|uniref:Btb/poz domain containing protein n=1 Tax=Rhizophagus irregularis (strain DAOM 197198w) TaxID=1432141 RepID=A0A015JP28_RHIIW|nr:hypothetical protein RirG_079890 [Rhizophagus irregularis DAOM 197198w]